MDVISIREALTGNGIRIGFGIERIGVVVVRVDLIGRGLGGGGGGGLSGIRVLGLVEEGKIVITRGHGRRQVDGNGEE